MDAHYDVLWRLLSRLGVPSGQVEDVAQEVLLVLARRVDDIEPGKEKAFLMATAVRAASQARRRQQRRPEGPDDEALLSTLDPAPAPDELLDQRRCRLWLDRLLGELTDEQREVLVLADHEGMTTAEIGALLAIPHGTVPSRLSRAREAFARRTALLSATMKGPGGDKR
ncbi:MAG TPA: sigma-70 family RNA polymerase sigma factor [Labilithrix sp.]|nr:sigma-70 family RNA polymerase sigma factor [Labilithrix sp.]